MLQSGDKTFLVDAGRGATLRLRQSDVQLTELDAVFLTHLHFDHISDLGDVIMGAWNLGRTDDLTVVGPPGLGPIVECLLGSVYAIDIEYRIREAALQGQVLRNPSEMVHVRTATEGTVWRDEEVSVSAGEVDHGDILEIPGWMAVGYRFEDATGAITVSGDSVPCPRLFELAQDTDVLIQCCYLSHDELSNDATRWLSRHVLGGADEAVEIARKSGVGKLVLSHLRQKSASELTELAHYVGSRVPCPVLVGEDLMVIDSGPASRSGPVR